MITNRSPQRVRRPVPVQLSVLYHPQAMDWSYCHHTSICYFKGKFYAMWSNGEINEDDVGQRVLYCMSERGQPVYHLLRQQRRHPRIPHPAPGPG